MNIWNQVSQEGCYDNTISVEGPQHPGKGLWHPMFHRMQSPSKENANLQGFSAHLQPLADHTDDSVWVGGSGSRFKGPTVCTAVLCCGPSLVSANSPLSPPSLQPLQPAPCQCLQNMRGGETSTMPRA